MAAPALTLALEVPFFALLPEHRPHGAILSSLLLHLGVLGILPALLIMMARPDDTPHQNVQMISLRTYEPITFDRLPRLSSSGSSSAGSAAPRAASSHQAAPAKSSRPAPSASPAKPSVVVYAGPQEIRSTPPHATNRVQTILRPDLVNPPKLKFPVRLSSMVVIPSAAAPVFVAPTPLEKNAETPAPVVPVVASELTEHPALPVPASPPHTAGNEPEPSAKKPEMKPPPSPAPLPDATTTSSKAALVVNAVTVPETHAEIPDAEIAGNFVVLPAKNTAESSNNSGGSDSSPAGDGSFKTPNNAGDATARSSGGSGTTGEAAAGGEKGTGKDSPSGSSSAKGSANSGAGASSPGGGTGATRGATNGKGSAAGSGTGPSSGTGSGGFPGMTIVGGSGGGRSRTPSGPRPGYDLTIVSGGSSGGASRDMGVFARNETVYTVYINMSDAGGGPDWSMQYALAGAEPAGNSLLLPPVASKKTAALARAGRLLRGPQKIFIAGTIDENGVFQGLHSLREADDLSKLAIDALAGWEFLPAQLAGKSVRIKVLIGVFATEASR